MLKSLDSPTYIYSIIENYDSRVVKYDLIMFIWLATGYIVCISISGQNTSIDARIVSHYWYSSRVLEASMQRIDLQRSFYLFLKHFDLGTTTFCSLLTKLR